MSFFDYNLLSFYFLEFSWILFVCSVKLRISLLNSLPPSFGICFDTALYLKIDLEIFDFFLRFSLLFRKRVYIHFLFFKFFFCIPRQQFSFFHVDLLSFLLYVFLVFYLFCCYCKWGFYCCYIFCLAL